MLGSKPSALPLGYTPTAARIVMQAILSINLRSTKIETTAKAKKEEILSSRRMDTTMWGITWALALFGLVLEIKGTQIPLSIVFWLALFFAVGKRVFEGIHTLRAVESFDLRQTQALLSQHDNSTDENERIERAALGHYYQNSGGNTCNIL